MSTQVLTYLRELVALSGRSGSEEPVMQAIARLARPLVDAVTLDPLGNLIATRRGDSETGPRLLLAAHMDEIGFRVRSIDAEGFLRFEKLGGSDNRVLLAQRVWVSGERGRLLGVIGTRSAHLLREIDRTSVPAHTELYVDVGARSADEAQHMGVRPGDPIGFAGELAELGHQSGRYTAHALDDRAGCAILLALLATLRTLRTPVTLTALFTVQEEVGLRGAQAASRGQEADVALAVDTTATGDTPEIAGGHLRLGGGPAIKMLDMSQIPHPAVARGLWAAADAAGLAAQAELLPGIGTDAGALQFGGHGVPAGTLSLGTRYTHSPVEVLDLADLEGAVSLLERFVEALPGMDLRFAALEE